MPPLAAEARPAYLAGELFLRLRAVLPDGFTVELEGPVLSFRSIQTEWSAQCDLRFMYSPPATEREAIVLAAYSALSTAQDFVSEDLTEPWPAENRDLALPSLEIIGDRLHCWYGSKEQPTLVLEPIEIASLISSE